MMTIKDLFPKTATIPLTKNEKLKLKRVTKFKGSIQRDVLRNAFNEYMEKLTSKDEIVINLGEWQRHITSHGYISLDPGNNIQYYVEVECQRRKASIELLFFRNNSSEVIDEYNFTVEGSGPDQLIRNAQLKIATAINDY